MARPRALLFDLDGTLLDSAPDLAGTANDMRAARGQAPLPYAALRPHAGSGARGMLGAAFGLAPGQTAYEALRDEFHDRYEQRMTRESALFGTVAGLLATLDAAAIPWAIVTNKALRFAAPLAQALPPLARAAALVAGDSTPHTKPHPAPLLEAARRLGLVAADCVYIGDDERDMLAARAAAMGAWAAAWGYLGPGQEAADWGADFVLAEPNEILKRLELA
ncbi:Phosphoglycolate phosphatase [Rubrivivax sp. A210]|uniref:HAD-IA family hydrolase n=1 Tax=Rubrivivax sp. A210 TaxID=2772301 RepID=UPI00191AED54|nr:HAD-IA family hydrolase [Rubrivivax sp. A210]CAD5373670.1 Phosphoglycolate phosphatase [Rubrivivax sp. A210]